MPSDEVLTCISDAGTPFQAAAGYVVQRQQISQRRIAKVGVDVRCKGKKWQTSSVTLPKSGKGSKPGGLYVRNCLLQFLLSNLRVNAEPVRDDYVDIAQ